MDLGMAGRTVLVTGGSTGIGSAIAATFAAAGARVALTYHENEDAAKKVAAELDGGGGQVMAVPYALETADSGQEAHRRVVAEFGEIDVFVANAFRMTPWRPPEEHFDEVTDEEIGSFVEDNLVSTMRTVRLVLPGMRSRGWGRIVFISSHIAAKGMRGQELYGAVKAGMEGFARSLCWDAAPDGILVNVVSPGMTASERVLKAIPEQALAGMAKKVPSGRITQPQDVASTVAFLGSAANGNINGQVVMVTGG